MGRHRKPFYGCIAWLGLVSGASAAEFPFEGIVTVKGSLNVRSGPTERYYRTGLLKPGDRVIVVGQQEGWLAIRPPAGSFSWVSGQYVRRLSPNEGEITGDKVNIRVGTPISEGIRDTTQLQLSTGARVRILEQKTFNQGPLAQLWYKIAPPPGEVRWVHADYIKRASGGPALPLGPHVTAGGSQAHGQAVAASPSPEPSPTSYWTPIRSAAPSSSNQAQASSPATDPSAMTGRPASQLLQKAEEAYQMMMRQRLNQRDLDSVGQLYAEAARRVQSGSARERIAHRLDELAQQKQRKAMLERVERFGQRSQSGDALLLSMMSRQQSRRAGHFDGNGILRKAALLIDGRPAYILFGPQGRLRYYVTPALRLDLKPYLGRRIAVRGVRRYRTDLRAHHIAIRQIVPIDLSNDAGMEGWKAGRVGTKAP